MRLARIRTESGVVAGEYEDGVVEAGGETYVVGEDGPLAPPCDPSALYCIGRNYAETLAQKGYERPEQPTYFIKPPVSVVPHEAPIPYPTFSEEVTYAGELVAVLGERCRNATPEEAEAAVQGFTIMNDVDALDQPDLTSRKAFDGSGPLGPWIETDVDPTAMDMYTDINGERRQSANTELMLWGPYELLSFLSERFTLRPGDAVAFGSPGNPGTIEPGDEIEIHYEGIGTLRNTVVSQE
ncbi:fumarylacetoacetate hydrolase family protein [Halolamina litorea]|jgi:2-keto-4-pentenoate hydratase/2-oxohepta-3-ene-1,7-dioic acid hydratase in catechol pathway|uniref:Fumarylacetoacetate hydrolase family protein n=1 Tax=Halolamina litorea TaxID=1515593 RepID=A0ABD6BLY4_9EURY|nr:fumarylacetoacetate hydrolase family protein [Halolamina litorea]